MPAQRSGKYVCDVMKLCEKIFVEIFLIKRFFVQVPLYFIYYRKRGSASYIVRE